LIYTRGNTTEYFQCTNSFALFYSVSLLKLPTS
jgi:hypothetical protein